MGTNTPKYERLQVLSAGKKESGIRAMVLAEAHRLTPNEDGAVGLQ